MNEVTTSEKEIKKKYPVKKIIVFLIFIFIIMYISDLTFREFFLREEHLEPAGTFSKYGFSIDYPDQTKITEQGVAEDKPNINSGGIEFIWKESLVRHDLFLMWVTESPLPNLEDRLNYIISTTQSEYQPSLIRGEKGNLTFKGHTMYYQLLQNEFEDRVRYYVYSVVYFDEIEKFFGFGYGCDCRKPLPELLERLETFEIT